ncbi:hypothetical protein HDV00_012695 [Rhizophlyctis rosea]|nr:hypothetical protein HDV00_012695 [Rhizophlyctis rosea]
MKKPRESQNVPSPNSQGKRPTSSHPERSVPSRTAARASASSFLPPPAGTTIKEATAAKLAKRRNYESAWWSRKQYACDFKTTNVELYRWHTTHLKVEEQKSIAEGLLRDPRGRIVMACTAAFAVRTRLERHVKGKHPKSWGRPYAEDEYVFTSDLQAGSLVGQLGQMDGASDHVGGSEVGGGSIGDYMISFDEDGVNDEQKPPKKGKGASADRLRIKYVCSWPTCTTEYNTKWELQMHFTNEHKVPLPLGENGRQKMFNMIPIPSPLVTAPDQTDATALPTTLPPNQPIYLTVPLLTSTYHLAMWRVLFRKLGPHVVGSIPSEELARLAGDFMAGVNFTGVNECVKNFVNGLSEGAETRAAGGSSRKGKDVAGRKKSATKAKKSTAKTPATSVRYWIDPTDIPFPTIRELEDEIRVCLKDGELIRVAKDASEDGDTLTNKKLAVGENGVVDLGPLRAGLESWCHTEFVVKAMKFVVECGELAKGMNRTLDDALAELGRVSGGGEGGVVPMEGAVAATAATAAPSGDVGAEEKGLQPQPPRSKPATLSDFSAETFSVISRSSFSDVSRMDADIRPRRRPSLSLSPYVDFSTPATAPPTPFPPASPVPAPNFTTISHADHPTQPISIPEPEPYQQQQQQQQQPQKPTPRRPPIRTIPASKRAANRSRAVAFGDENVAVIAKLGARVRMLRSESREELVGVEEQENSGGRKSPGKSGSGRVPLSPIKVAASVGGDPTSPSRRGRVPLSPMKVGVVQGEREVTSPSRRVVSGSSGGSSNGSSGRKSSKTGEFLFG